MAPLLVVSGPPGAGKTTVATSLAERFEPSALVSGDAFFAFLRRGATEPWRPGADAQNEVVTRAAASAGHFARGGYTTVYDGVVGPWFLPTFVGGAAVDELHYVLLLPSVESCVERVVTRHGHGFTDEPATRRVHAQLASADIEPRQVLDADPPLDAVVAELLQRFAANELRLSSPATRTGRGRSGR